MKPKYIHSEQEIATISDRILKARTTCSGLSEYPGVLPETLDTAYRVQDLSISNWQGRIVGWKVGGIPPQLQEQYQAERLSGPIYSSTVKYADTTNVVAMPVFEHGYAAIEAEFIIELGDVSALPSEGITEQQIIDVVTNIYIGVEIASSPIQKINDLGPVGPISDFGNNSGLIVGAKVENWQQIDLTAVKVTTTIDDTVHGPATVLPNLKGPLGAVKFLIEQLKHRGYSIEPGTLVSSGAITGVHDAFVGAKSLIEFDGLGEVHLELISKQQ